MENWIFNIYLSLQILVSILDIVDFVRYKYHR
ncbi:hypothetical protein D8862_09145 [Streptococcus oralis]|uniref:Uncharacterized protein n=1 Tax=Streptococcus oralis TaxID=1303 RepID=A0A3R9HX28_STROR|nr:hypothetical protein D8862_09145 [Streptococcus oralis]